MRQILATEEEIRALGFDPKVLACKCCGIVRADLLALQRLRGFEDSVRDLGIGLRMTSFCRCWKHHAAEYQRLYPDNWQMKVTKLSAHLIDEEHGEERIAYGADYTASRAGLRHVTLLLEDEWQGGFSFYDRETNPSIHLDIGRKRRW